MRALILNYFSQVSFDALKRVNESFNLPILCISQSCTEIKIKFFIFILLCGASKGFMNTFKAFIKPFMARQRSVKIKI